MSDGLIVTFRRLFGIGGADMARWSELSAGCMRSPSRGARRVECRSGSRRPHKPPRGDGKVSNASVWKDGTSRMELVATEICGLGGVGASAVVEASSIPFEFSTFNAVVRGLG